MSGFVHARANDTARRRSGAFDNQSNGNAGAEPAPPQTLSLLQMREALDRSPRVQSQAALQRALDASAAAKGPQKRKEKPSLQRAIDSSAAGGKAPPKRKEKSPIQKKANATGLPDQLKVGVETLSGLSMDDVRVHYNSAKPAAMQAHAYTQGTNIHVAPGQEKHLPHEAWHVVQQKQGRVKPTLQMKGVAINDDTALEREADTMAAKAAGIRGASLFGASDASALPRGIVVQREPFIWHKGGLIDLGSISWSKLNDLAQEGDLEYQQAAEVEDELARRRNARYGAAGNQPAAPVADKKEASESQSLKGSDAKDVKSSIKDAAIRGAGIAVSAGANVASGGIAGHVEAGARAAWSAYKAAKINDILKRAEAAERDVKNQRYHQQIAPPALISALTTIRDALVIETVAEAAGAWIPLVASLVRKGQEEKVALAYTAITVLDAPLAREAMDVLSLQPIENLAGEYGSTGSTKTSSKKG